MRINGIDYAGQHNRGLTMTLDETIKIPSACTSSPDRGIAVGMVGAGTVGKGAAPLMGRLETIEDDARGTVFNRGVVVVPWNGDANAFGWMNVVAENGFARNSAENDVSGQKASIKLVLGVSNGYAAIDLG